MKELSIEEKVRRYDEAVEKARQIHDADRVSGIELTTCEEIFPELAESEDARIRKRIIDALHGDVLEMSEIKEAVSWLEKQGEQKPADMVEPKFHEGDWIIHHGTENIYQVVSIIDNQYQLKYGDNYTIQNCADVDRCARLWNITKDAKDGDVLFTSSTASHETFIFKSIDEKGNAKCYFAYDSEDGFREGKYHFIGKATDCKPATKEQRDLLFQKMKESGYEWDAEKKELKKIEQKPAWGEEDEDNFELDLCDDCSRSLSYNIRNWLKTKIDFKERKEK